MCVTTPVWTTRSSRRAVVGFSATALQRTSVVVNPTYSAVAPPSVGAVAGTRPPADQGRAFPRSQHGIGSGNVHGTPLSNSTPTPCWLGANAAIIVGPARRSHGLMPHDMPPWLHLLSCTVQEIHICRRNESALAILFYRGPGKHRE